jgi:predicted AAA+ superfamily ATPase
LVRPSSARLWFSSYILTYLERDVRAISSIRDLATFRRFLALLASRCGYILNRTDLAAPLGVSIPTISEWVSILEIAGQILKYLHDRLKPAYSLQLVRTPGKNKGRFASGGVFSIPAVHFLSFI